MLEVTNAALYHASRHLDSTVFKDPLIRVGRAFDDSVEVARQFARVIRAVSYWCFCCRALYGHVIAYTDQFVVAFLKNMREKPLN